MKFRISWIEDAKPVYAWSCHNIISAFVEVYGVSEFIINFGDKNIFGSRFISKERDYDLEFFRMCNCFLTRRQIIKLYKRLIKGVKIAK